MFEELFLKKKISIPSLLNYGFEKSGDEYKYSHDIMDGDFMLFVTFDCHGNLSTSVKEPDTGEEYTLYKTTAEGAFVGKVRGEISEVLRDIADKCFKDSQFKYKQTYDILSYAAQIYGSEPEFLWDSLDGVLRRRDTGKWYGIVMTVKASKLGINSDRIIEILNLHAEHEKVKELLKQPGFYPAWHMNKKSWFTVILDGSVENEVLFEFMVQSYKLAKK